MSDETDSVQPADTESGSSLRKQLEEALAAKGELEGQLAGIARDSAFKDAGVPTDKWGTYFRKGYEGDMTPEAIAAAVAEAGLGESNSTQAVDQSAVPAPTPQQNLQQEALAAEQQVLQQAATLRQTPAPAAQSDPHVDAMKALDPASPTFRQDLLKITEQAGVLEQG